MSIPNCNLHKNLRFEIIEKLFLFVWSELQKIFTQIWPFKMYNKIYKTNFLTGFKNSLQIALSLFLQSTSIALLTNKEKTKAIHNTNFYKTLLWILKRVRISWELQNFNGKKEARTAVSIVGRTPQRGTIWFLREAIQDLLLSNSLSVFLVFLEKQRW